MILADRTPALTARTTEVTMFLATRIPYLTDQMLANTLRAAEASAQGVDWLMLAEIEWLERRLQTLQHRLEHGTAPARRAA
jgi:hypothetical protein